MPIKLAQFHEVSEGSVDALLVTLHEYLFGSAKAGDREKVASVDGPTEIGSSDLAMGATVNTDMVLLETGEEVAASESINVSISGQQAGTVYTVECKVTTTKDRELVFQLEFGCV